MARTRQTARKMASFPKSSQITPRNIVAAFRTTPAAGAKTMPDGSSNPFALPDIILELILRAFHESQPKIDAALGIVGPAEFKTMTLSDAHALSQISHCFYALLHSSESLGISLAGAPSAHLLLLAQSVVIRSIILAFPNVQTLLIQNTQLTMAPSTLADFAQVLAAAPLVLPASPLAPGETPSDMTPALIPWGLFSRLLRIFPRLEALALTQSAGQPGVRQCLPVIPLWAILRGAPRLRALCCLAELDMNSKELACLDLTGRSQLVRFAHLPPGGPSFRANHSQQPLLAMQPGPLPAVQRLAPANPAGARRLLLYLFSACTSLARLDLSSMNICLSTGRGDPFEAGHSLYELMSSLEELPPGGLTTGHLEAGLAIWGWLTGREPADVCPELGEENPFEAGNADRASFTERPIRCPAGNRFLYPDAWQTMRTLLFPDSVCLPVEHFAVLGHTYPSLTRLRLPFLAVLVRPTHARALPPPPPPGNPLSLERALLVGHERVPKTDFWKTAKGLLDVEVNLEQDWPCLTELSIHYATTAVRPLPNEPIKLPPQGIPSPTGAVTFVLRFDTMQQEDDDEAVPAPPVRDLAFPVGMPAPPGFGFGGGGWGMKAPPKRKKAPAKAMIPEGEEDDDDDAPGPAVPEPPKKPRDPNRLKSAEIVVLLRLIPGPALRRCWVECSALPDVARAPACPPLVIVTPRPASHVSSLVLPHGALFGGDCLATRPAGGMMPLAVASGMLPLGPSGSGHGMALHKLRLENPGVFTIRMLLEMAAREDPSLALLGGLTLRLRIATCGALLRPRPSSSATGGPLRASLLASLIHHLPSLRRLRVAINSGVLSDPDEDGPKRMHPFLWNNGQTFSFEMARGRPDGQDEVGARAEELVAGLACPADYFAPDDGHVVASELAFAEDASLPPAASPAASAADYSGSNPIMRTPKTVPSRLDMRHPLVIASSTLEVVKVELLPVWFPDPLPALKRLTLGGTYDLITGPLCVMICTVCVTMIMTLCVTTIMTLCVTICTVKRMALGDTYDLITGRAPAPDRQYVEVVRPPAQDTSGHAPGQPIPYRPFAFGDAGRMTLRMLPHPGAAVPPAAMVMPLEKSDARPGFVLQPPTHWLAALSASTGLARYCPALNQLTMEGCEVLMTRQQISLSHPALRRVVLAGSPASTVSWAHQLANSYGLPAMSMAHSAPAMEEVLLDLPAIEDCELRQATSLWSITSACRMPHLRRLVMAQSALLGPGALRTAIGGSLDPTVIRQVLVAPLPRAPTPFGQPGGFHFQPMFEPVFM
ncbi:hypothetical protein PAPYR_8922 [Paratrimastix pyriformis]|uniref:F-box domain-containing protein n=1 Tax=Paratrimastix pyriformis TaxID=342808 RepID=A0ABQ8U9N6_9EUKA|nr:hypothetical protein PAPYR_8922 [Paratrimastix pyriformis]